MVARAEVVGGAHHPLTPVPCRVVGRRVETEDVVTLAVEPPGGLFSHRAGQFNMVTVFGVGEVPISISGVPGATPVEHTVRDVGPVTRALCAVEVGGVVGLRGPYGTDWGSDGLGAADVVVVAGGIGLAPLRGAVEELLAGGTTGRVCVVAGARSPAQVMFAADLDRWRRMGAQVELTVDVGDASWGGPVGLVTSRIPEARFDPTGAVAMLCGPEVMMRFTARALTDRGVRPQRIRVSLERNMQCGVGLCGHCQLGPFIVCRDGPVLPYGGAVAGLLMERER